MNAEVAFHLEARATDLMREHGLTEAEARRRARLEFGGIATHKDGMRHSLGLRLWDELLADIVYGARILRKSPGFTAIAVGSLALAIGANTTIFSLANEMLYTRLAVPHPEQLQLVAWSGGHNVIAHSNWGSQYPNGTGGILSESFTFPIYEQMRRDNRALEDIFAFKDMSRVNATVDGNAQPISVEFVTGNMYAQMDTRPQLGRPIEDTDDILGSAGVAVISEGFWERAYGRSPDAIGKVISLDSNPVTIIGVNASGFTGAKSVQSSPEVFLPMSLMPLLRPEVGNNGPILTSTRLWWVQMMGRLKPGASAEQARAALDVSFNAAARATVTIAKGDQIPNILLEDGSRGMNASGRSYAKPMYVLLTMVGLVLLLACANTANLLLARAAARHREMTVRLALGASRWRVLRQVITESLMLSALGGVCGLILGYLGRNTLPRLLVNAWERNDLNVPFDWRVFGFTASVTILTGLLFGLFPAWAATRANVSAGLKDTANTSTKRRKGWSGRAIVAFQLALSTLLVVASGLFLRSLVKLNSVDAGFRTDHLILFEINPPDRRYVAGKDITLHNQIEDRLATIPGVEGVVLSDIPLISESGSNSTLFPEGADANLSAHATESNTANLADVSQNYIPVMGIPMIAGRGFESRDTETSQPVSVINQALAKKFFPNVNPIGRHFLLDRHRRSKDTGPKERWIEVIGICADFHYSSLRREPPPVHFDLYRQQPVVGGMVYMVRTRMDPDAIVPSLRAAIQAIDPDLPMMNVRTQQQQIDATMQQERMFATLTSGFGILALALACVGIYGIMAYSVSQRTNEIGIRLALGARRNQVRVMVLREAGWLSLLGVVAGLAVAIALGKLVKSMLYGLQPNDPLSLAGSALLLVTVALVAGWVPAVRASRVEPMQALRHE
ncbi:protein of unknown function DUF214 [Granulicella sibirica]|uniref:Permease n=2 Tax=Granulicella sibirica TaxID=2479048 RepID=A0A4Q0T6X2_9BACT|nr:protein of unknown function DUF214 [Granulicella sibirica]